MLSFIQLKSCQSGYLLSLRENQIRYNIYFNSECKPTDLSNPLSPGTLTHYILKPSSDSIFILLLKYFRRYNIKNSWSLT